MLFLLFLNLESEVTKLGWENYIVSYCYLMWLADFKDLDIFYLVLTKDMVIHLTCKILKTQR